MNDLRDHLKNMVAPTQLSLPRSVLTRAQTAIADIHTFAHSAAWLRELRSHLADSRQIAALETQAPDSSVLTSYDFHYDIANDQLSLIEINTNASMFLLAAELSDDTTREYAMQKLRASFFEEWNNRAPQMVRIIDDEPLQQKTYFEFLMYSDLFREWGADDVTICDTGELNLKILQRSTSFVYNRSTDFYFESSKALGLWQAWHSASLTVSPHPREYLLLADKQRLIDFAERKISNVLIPTRHIRSFDGPDDLWAQRKNLVFKPRTSFGGKGVFRGVSISNKTFQDIMTKDYIVQEFRPAGEWQGQKFDLRLFVYKSDIQLICARLYTGQVTNFSGPNGGIAAVQIK